MSAEPQYDEENMLAAEADENEANNQLLELQDALVSALTMSGVLGCMRAQLRATALAMLRGDGDLQRAALENVTAVREVPFKTRVALLLIQEFLQSKNLLQSSGVLEAEANTPILAYEEKEHVKGTFADLPGEGSVLERLVQLTLTSGCKSIEGTFGSSISTTTTTTASAASSGDHRRIGDSVSGGGGAATTDVISGSGGAGHTEGSSHREEEEEGDEEEEAAAAAAAAHDDDQPTDAAVEKALACYEESVTFSDNDGRLDEYLYDNIETL